MEERTCSVEGCGRAAVARGWCNRHWKHWRTHGSPTAGRFTVERAVSQTFVEWALAQETDDCIDWPYRTRSGYGYVGGAKDYTGVHVLACIAEHGECPPDKREVGHSCGRRICMNRRHVRWVTKAENEEDSFIHGTHTRGTRNRNAKLTEEQVLMIHSSDRMGIELAAELGVSKATISRVRHGVRYGTTVV